AGPRAVEFEEILGYHLEQAYAYRTQLGRLGEDTRRLGERAGEVLGSAGRRAFARGDAPAAVNLLARSAALLPDDHPTRLQVLPERGRAPVRTGGSTRAGAGVAGAGERRAARGEP